MQSTQSFILRTVNYKESDKILTLFTHGLGRVSAIAKGARKSQKRFGGALEAFALMEVSLSKGARSGRMYTLSEATLLNSHRALERDLQRIGAAAFILELTREVVPEEEPNGALFDIVKSSMEVLGGDGHIFPRSLSIAAALRLLAQSGFAISTSACNACGKKVPEGKPVYFDALRGGVVCTPCGGGPILIEGPAATAFASFSRIQLEEAAKINLGNGEWTQIECALDTFVQQHLEKNLKTAGFRQQVFSE